jgi:K+-sensing histidine kinase KdpD
MEKLEVALVGCTPELGKAVAKAIGHEFKGAEIIPAKDIIEALMRRPMTASEVVVLCRPKPEDVSNALDAVDPMGLPRWAIVLVGTNPVSNWVETLSVDELTASLVARAFRSAIEQKNLRREIARAKGDKLTIGSRVSHDIRTELAGIRSNAELMRDNLSRERPQPGSPAEHVFDSVDVLGRIIERLSFLMKASVRGVDKKQFEMGHVVLRAVQRVDPEIQRRRATIVQPNFWPKVNGDAASAERVWSELLGNALVHARDQPRIQLGWTRKESEHRMWISDDGVGVPLEKRPTLFRPFHVMHRLNSPRGMGLPIVQRLVDLHGGSCGYEPSEDGGARFFFTLPT